MVTHMRIATPTPDGTRHKPEGWSIIPVTLIDKKEESDVVRERRNIAKLSQGLKVHAALYEPAYARVMPRLPDNNHGWAKGVSGRGAAQMASLAIDHAHLLEHPLIMIWGDIKRFFPAMDRDFVICAEWWYGLPQDVRDATLQLYGDACNLFETAHGLADLDFSKVRTKCGYVQGCVLSTEKAKLFIASLAEAIDVSVRGGGVRFWSGRGGGTQCEQASFCADDLVGMLTSWQAAAKFFAVLDQWAHVTASRLGIGNAKTTYSAVRFDENGRPCDLAVPSWFAPTVCGKKVPKLPFGESYPHVGNACVLQGDQAETRAKAVKHAGVCAVAPPRQDAQGK